MCSTDPLPRASIVNPSTNRVSSSSRQVSFGRFPAPVLFAPHLSHPTFRLSPDRLGVLLEQLTLRREGLRGVRPFHSFRDRGPQGPKLFPHVAVLPRYMFNTNRGDTCTGATRSGRKNEWRCDFIFHAAGKPAVWTPEGLCTRKLEAFRCMVHHAGLGALLDHDADHVCI